MSQVVSMNGSAGASPSRPRVPRRKSVQRPGGVLNNVAGELVAKPEAAESDGVLFRSPDLSVAIPTYGREQVLLDTVRSFVERQTQRPGEILVVDQTLRHARATESALA